MNIVLSVMLLVKSSVHRLIVQVKGTVMDSHDFWLLVVILQVKGMGMDSPELLLLVENCPRGAETLVTRIIHILTDKGSSAHFFVFTVITGD